MLTPFYLVAPELHRLSFHYIVCTAIPAEPGHDYYSPVFFFSGVRGRSERAQARTTDVQEVLRRQDQRRGQDTLDHHPQPPESAAAPGGHGVPEVRGAAAQLEGMPRG